MNQIITGLYIGSYTDVHDEDQMERNNITHVLSLYGGSKEKIKGVTYKYVDIDDDPTEDLTKHFQDSINFIHKYRMKSKNVLVHCLAGISRSVTITIAYLMTVTSIGWKECLDVVKIKRKKAKPNSGFIKQLQTYEEGKVQMERSRMNRMFKPSVFNDEKECRKFLESQDAL